MSSRCHRAPLYGHNIPCASAWDFRGNAQMSVAGEKGETVRNDRDQEQWNALLVDLGLRSKRSARRHSHPDPQVRSALATIPQSVNWAIVAGFALALALLCGVLWIGDARIAGPATLAFILVGWVF